MALLSISSKGELAVLTKPRYLRHSLFLGTLARMPLEGGAPREIVDFVREADWNPDGSELAVTRDVNGKDRLEFPLGKVLAETGGYLSNPRFSPRGDRIAFFEHPFKYDDRGSVAVVDLAGKKTVLSEGYGVEEGLAWSRDGREVLFSGGTDYFNTQIYAVGLDGKRRSAAQSAGGITILDVASDGRWLASRDEAWRDMFGLGPGQDKERNLSWLELSYPGSAHARTARRCSSTEKAAASGSTTRRACVRPTDLRSSASGTARRSTSAGMEPWALAACRPIPASSSSTRPEPDSRKLSSAAARESMKPASSSRTPGAIAVCGHEAGQAVRCHLQRPLAGGAPAPPITPQGTSNGLISPDGTQILTSSSAGVMGIYPVSGASGGAAGESRPVPGTSPDDAAIGWMSDGKSILVSSHWWEVPLRIQRSTSPPALPRDVATCGPAS